MKQWSFVLAALSLLLLIIVPACGKEEKTPTAAPTDAFSATPTKTIIATITPTPTPAGPVKIGVIAPWSRPMAMTGMLTESNWRAVAAGEHRRTRAA